MFSAAVETVLDQGLDALPFAVSPKQRGQLLVYLQQLNRWNVVHNLTAVRDCAEQVRLHVLDCLSIVAYLPPCRVLADIGSGAGLPALIVAVMRPEMTVYAVEAGHKKAAFIRQTALAMGCENVQVIGERVEHWQPEQNPDVIVSRAMAAPDTLLTLTAHLGHAQTQWVLMCGPSVSAATHADFALIEEKQLTVPQLDAQRILLILRRREAA